MAKKIIAWSASNPITVLSALVAFVTLIALVVIHSKGESFLETVKSRESDLGTLRNLARTPVKLPPENPDGRPINKDVAVNAAAIDELKNAYERMDEEYDRIVGLALTVNQGVGTTQHLPMDDNLFPQPSDPGKPFAAKDRYNSAFDEMLRPHTVGALLPRLDAGMPLPRAVLNEVVQEETQTYLNQTFFEDVQVSRLDEVQREKLRERLRQRLINVMSQHARDIHIYANVNADRWSEAYPFDVMAWSKPGEPPTMEQLWEGQMGLWIQQDIAEAIARTNRVDEKKHSVLTAPIKRLLDINVVPGYVGITTRGAIVSGEGRGANLEEDPDARIQDDFSISHTGRRSNAIYDVRHVRLKIHADSRRLNQFFDNLAKVNFMTVLQVKMTQVDEYAMLNQGFVYGPHDVVEVDMVIETVWLREWTTRFMPEVVQRIVGVPMPEEQEGAPTS